MAGRRHKYANSDSRATGAKAGGPRPTWAGAAELQGPSRNLHAVHHFLHPLTLIDFTAADADAYASVRARLQKRGRLIGPLDMLLAAQALARGLTLVTNSEREFRRVQGLDLVSWVG